MISQYDLIDLSRHLKQERLFIGAEREQLQILNEEVGKSAERLYHLAWIARQQKVNLDKLILANQEVTPEVCCRRTNALENANFVDGYKLLSYHESKTGEFLKGLRESPKLVASCLIQAEKIGQETLQNMAKIIMTGIYGNTVMPEDENYILQVLKALIELQVVSNSNPRRLLRKGSCAFSVMFKLLNESLFSAKLFLTAALHKPVMQLLMEDEWFYDIDPDRALYRFPPQDRNKRFSQPGSDEYTSKTKHYRDITTSKLAMLAERFIGSLKSNMYCFPTSLNWIISQLYHTITKAEQVSMAEARAMCADLVFAFFICPAICDPEPFGITSDAPISYIARHNLMQVAQMLQVLALSTWDEVDTKTKDLYGKFEKGCMSFLLDGLLDPPASEHPPQPGSQLTGCCRAAVLLTCNDLVNTITLLRDLISEQDEECGERKQLERLLTNVPPVSVILSLQTHSTSPNCTPQPTPPGTPSSAKKLINKSLREKKRLFLGPDSASDNSTDGESVQQVAVPEDVLVISLGIVNECPGMVAEQKVLEQENKQRKFNSLVPGEDDPISESEIQLHEKRTRFSLSHDQDSIATSDNLEAISEAASSHSVTSDLDNENDNLSDFVSANVSGRGTPNISGRDTPISQAGSHVDPVEERNAPNLPVIVQKENREDVTERFGKFEIKNELERDETKSTVSDTWSTDVLASDSEPPEQTQFERLTEVAEEMVRQNLLGVQEVSELSETTSDAWSTDVLASDTSERQMDRLMELDQDDVASVSSRSQAQDSEVGDQLEPGEDTPQASGRQSPREDSEAQTGSMQGERGNASDRFSDPTLERSFAARERSQFENAEELKRRHVSDIVTGYQKIEQHKFSYIPNPRISTSFKYAEGKVGMGLTNFDPATADNKKDPGDEEDCLEERELFTENGSGMVRGGEAIDQSADSDVMSPDQGIGGVSSLDSGGEYGSVTSPSVEPDDANMKRSQDSGVAATPQDISSSVDSLTNTFASDALKLTDQQNINIDAQRLSIASMSLFDPLMQETSTDPQAETDQFRRLSEPNITSSSSSSSSSSYNNRQSYQDMGARPKVPTSMVESNHIPRISFQLNNVTVSNGNTNTSPEKTSGGGILVSSSRNPYSPKSKSAPPLVSSDSGVEVGDLVSFDNSPNSHVEKTIGNGFVLQNGEAQQKRPSSGDSILVVSTVETSAAAKNSVTEGISQRLEDDDRKSDKKKGSFFHSFKERLSKGGGKRKIGKPLDPSLSTLAMDIEKGTDCAATSHARSAPSSSQAGDGEDMLTKVKATLPGYARSQSDEPSASVTESTDDILARYRKPTSTPVKNVESSTSSATPSNQKEKEASQPEEAEPPAYDPSNLETCKAFLDAKKKLRLVLSTADFQAIPTLTSCHQGSCRQGNDRKDNDLVAFLKVQLAEAINLQDKDLIAQLHETIRCLRQFDNQEMKKLLKTMKEEYRSRSPYIAYLVRCRQGLLSSLAHIDRLLNRVQRDKAICNKYFLSVFVRLFLEKRERHLMSFISDFQKLTMSDEKTRHVEQFLEFLHKELEEDPVWQASSESQVKDARLYIERNVMSHVYTHAMYPNGDGDIMRDQILHEHMGKLAQVITTRHKDLRIPKMYHYECPWPAAQAEIFMINAYKTPKDKLQCVLRCSSTIMNLLSMANEKSVPAADDFMPVLIFVLIKANPPSLLSTVQYVTSFYEKRLGGEEQYWWMQFTSGIEFIKTMDY